MTQIKTLDKDWWRGAVIYQIYPRSYQDSNGDGIGDLPGITQRLDYIAALGVDAIWISPFFKSPMLDFGYDVSDYRDVDPMFGTLSDFDALIQRAHDLGLKVLIDLVLSHTSDQHPWFAQSRMDRAGEKSDWYVWADAKPDGTPPNNWLSIFGGPAWEWSSERQQYYLHNFLSEQPDLNLHNTDVQDELLDTARFWLDRGVDGFRLDTINFYFHDPLLRDNPALPPEQRNDKIAPSVNPYNWQNHLYDKNQPENLEFLKRLRSVLNEYPAATMVGEVGDAQRGLEIQAQYTADGDKAHMCYDFAFLSQTFPSGSHVADVITAFDATGPDSWACWAFSNHDVMRHASRWSLNDSAQRTLAALLLSLRGSVCLYQGEELGLTEADVPFEALQDPYGIRFWPKFKGRDGCRTPMPWTKDNRNGGFSDGRTWLPVDTAHLARAVSEQSIEPDSLMSFYRDFIAFRRAHSALVNGSFEVVSADSEHVSFIRKNETQAVFCAFNLSDATRQIALPNGNWVPATDAPFETVTAAPSIATKEWSAFFATAKIEELGG